MRVGVKNKPGEADAFSCELFGVVLCGRRPSQNRLDAGQQLAGAEGFWQIVVRPDLEPYDPVGLLPQRCQHEDRQGAFRRQPLANGEPVLAGHHHVEHKEVVVATGEAGIHFDGILRRRRAHAVLLQVTRDQFADLAMIVDDENVRAVCHGASCLPKPALRGQRPVCHRLYQSARL